MNRYPRVWIHVLFILCLLAFSAILPAWAGTNPPALRPSIITQPQSQTVTVGSDVSFSVIATGTQPLVYRWQRNSTVLSISTNPVLRILNVQTNHAGLYRVAITNVAGITFSSNAVLQVLPDTNAPPTPPVIIAQPEGVTALAGANVTFSVRVSGTEPLTYRWRFNDVFLSGANGPDLTVFNVQPANAGNYSVLVTNVAGFAFSSNAVLQVITNTNPPPVPPRIIVQPQNQIAVAGQDVVLSVEATGTAPLYYLWQFNGFFLPGATNSILSLPNVQTNQWGDYVAWVGNDVGVVTSVVARVLVLPGTNSTARPIIVTQPQSQTVLAGADVTFSVTATGTEPLFYQWRRGATFLPGATNSTLTLLNVQTNQTGNYRVSVTNAFGIALSSNAFLQVLFNTNPPPVAPVIVTNPQDRIVVAGSSVFFFVGAQGTTPLRFQWLYNGEPLAGATNQGLSLLNVQTNQAGYYQALVTNIAGLAYSSNALLQVIANTNAPVAPTIVGQPQSLSVPVGSTAFFSVAASGTAPLSYRWLHNGAFLVGASGPFLLLSNVQPANAGNYSVLVTNVAGAVLSSNAFLQVTVSTNSLVPPTITTQPQSQTVMFGSAVTFFVGATGSEPLSYRWRRNGGFIFGATNAAFTIPFAQFSNAANYSVVVTNAAGMAFSSNAVLQVILPTNVPPTVVMTSPLNGAVISSSAIVLGAAANDPGGFVTKVEFFAGTNRIAQDFTTPYTQVWSNVPPGSYELRAVATDNSNAVAISTPVNITVADASGSLVLVPTGAVWRYLDNGSDQGVAWRSPVFNDSTWPLGPAQLGFGDGDEATLVSPGPDPLFRNATTYFRHPFNVASPGNITGLTVRLLRDDGAVVYLNGVEVFRSNMPEGSIDYTTLAPTAGDETNFFTASVPNGLLVAGQNVLAVEVHQNTVTSSDLSFDLELRAQTSTPTNRVAPVIVSHPQSRTVNVGGGVTFNVVATGTPPLIYRWRHENTIIALTTNSSLTLFNVQPAQAGAYAVVVSNLVGSATSSNAILTVVQTNLPPVAESQLVTVDEDSGKSIVLTGSDPEGVPLIFAIVSPPAHGTLTAALPTNQNVRLYRPARDYFGPDSFAFTVSDGFLRSTGVVSITVNPVNDPPVASIQVSPLTILFPNEANSLVIASNNQFATVWLDATRSFDPENDPLQFSWMMGEFNLAFGQVTNTSLGLGDHLIRLIVDDGTAIGTGGVLVEVITPGDAVEEIISKIENAAPPRFLRRPLIATLEMARNSFDAGDLVAGSRRLQAFQHKVALRVAPLNPTLAALLIGAAQGVIEAVGGPVANLR